MFFMAMGVEHVCACQLGILGSLVNIMPLDELPLLEWTLCQRCVTLHRCLGL